MLSTHKIPQLSRGRPVPQPQWEDQRLACMDTEICRNSFSAQGAWYPAHVDLTLRKR